MAKSEEKLANRNVLIKSSTDYTRKASKKAKNNGPTRTVLLEGLKFLEKKNNKIDIEALKKVAEPYGTIKSFNVPARQFSGKSKG